MKARKGKTPVRLGIIGCGVISGSHLKLAAGCPEAEVVAVADLIPEKANARAKEFGIPTVYFNDTDLINDPRVEAVILAMPVADRTPVAFKALRHGKHVLLEKPVAAKASDVKRMMAMRNGRTIGCCSSRMTFTRYAEAAAKCVASGALGKIRMVRIRAIIEAGATPAWNPPPPWRQSMALNGGGILVNWSCYDLDYMMFVTGWQLRPRVALAHWWRPGAKMADRVAPGSDADAHYVALIDCADDVVLSMERAEMAATTSDQAWEIIGTEGALHMPLLPPGDKPHAIVLDRFAPGKGVVSKTIWSEENSPSTGDVDSDFVHAIRTGTEPRTSLKQALLMQNITDAIYASAAKGRSVAVGTVKLGGAR